MINKRIKWFFIAMLLPITATFGSYGNYGSDIFDILGILVGIFFLWGLIKIIQEGNAREDIPENDFEMIDHFLKNDLPEE